MRDLGKGGLGWKSDVGSKSHAAGAKEKQRFCFIIHRCGRCAFRCDRCVDLKCNIKKCQLNAGRDTDAQLEIRNGKAFPFLPR
jgi:hypothetical protein